MVMQTQLSNQVVMRDVTRKVRKIVMKKRKVMQPQTKYENKTIMRKAVRDVKKVVMRKKMVAVAVPAEPIK